MAFRIATAAFPMRGLLQSFQKVPSSASGLGIRKSSIFVEPPVPWLSKPSVVFSAGALKHHWGCLPVIMFTLVGLTLEVAALVRLAATRDDVWYTRGSAACEFIERRKGYPVPIRKLLVFNQKYENPQGLMDAVLGDVNGPPYCPQGDKCDTEEGYFTAKALAAHAAIGISALCAMLVL